MKTILFTIFILFAFHAYSQTYVKVADKPEYEKYLSYCNTHDYKTFEVLGKVTVLKVNGYYTDPDGKYYIKEPLTITWQKIGATSVTVSEFEKLISVKVTLQTRRRTPSIPDFYKEWMTHRLP